MGGIEGVRFIPLAAGGSAPDALVRLLLSGAVLRGRVAADGALLNLMVAGQRVPLPKSVALPPGTTVEVQLSHETGSAQLRLRVLDSAGQTAASPQPSGNPPQAASAPAVPMPDLPAAIAALFKPEQTAVLLPKLASIPPRALEALLQVFVARGDGGRILARLAMLVSAEAAEGRLPAEAGAAIGTLAQAMDAESPEELRRAIELARELVGARGERAGSTPNDTGKPPRDVLDEIAQLRESLSSRGARGEGLGATEVMKTLDAFVERIANSTLQNVRALDTPYQFLAIPFSPRTGIEHAQVHVMGRDGGRGGGGREAQVVALDLQLTHLGALWITIQSSGPACNCVIRAGDDMVRRAIEQGVGALEAGLRRAGFAAAQVRTEAWDGDRVAAATDLLSRPSNFEAEA